jgi:selenocysteine lyase/cysteine desulfurase
MVGWSRRDVLVASGVIGGAAAIGSLAGCSSGDQSSGEQQAQREAGAGEAAGSGFDPSDWASVREQFPLSPDLRHFAAFVLAAHPRPVTEAIERHRRGLDEDPEGYLAAEEESNEIAVREAASRYLGGGADQVALTDSTTMGLGLVYGGLRLTPRDEVVTTEHDFYSTHEALRLRSERTGCRVRRIRLYDDPARADGGQMVERIVGSLTPSTRVVALTWVHSSTGVKVPVADVASALAEQSAGRDVPVLLCVDAVHGLGAEDTSPDQMGCDFLIGGTHKWLFGPRGTGIVWGRNDAWSLLDAIIPPFEPGSYTAWLDGRDDGTGRGAPGQWATPGGYHSFEHRWALTQAFEFHLDIGKRAVTDRIQTQATQLKEGLADLSGVELVTPLDSALSSGIVCASMVGHEPARVVAQLRDQGISASVTPYRQPYVRFGPGIVTTPDDVDALIEAVATLT